MGLFGPPDVAKLKVRGDTPGLIKALENWRVRDAASEALAQIGAPAVEPLIAALGDATWTTRIAAAKTLGKMGDPRAVNPLAERLGDDVNVAAAAAAEALGRIGDPRAVERLAAALQRPSTTTDVDLQWIVWALGEIGDERAVQALTNALEHQDVRVRRAAAETLDALYRNGRMQDGPKARVDMILTRQRPGSAAQADPVLLRRLAHQDLPEVSVPAAHQDYSSHRDVMIEVSSDCNDLHDDSGTGYWR